MGIPRRDTQRIFRTLQSKHFLNIFIKILRLGGRGETLYYAAVLRDKEFREVPEDVPPFFALLLMPLSMVCVAFALMPLYSSFGVCDFRYSKIRCASAPLTSTFFIRGEVTPWLMRQNYATRRRLHACGRQSHDGYSVKHQNGAFVCIGRTKRPYYGPVGDKFFR